ncbi:hypothetical protein B0I35DRAFT_474397 [Stachybotrys elegans]|uniref:Uncharacterized protein n=1 Tax=Stachybotrys elegans TaxID=80388 RepID=A0A8K0SZF2_9HYPO|nr:hypothetical protein B0I35DRAFT_474397 [Stachybotrys elegans]
MPTFSIIPTLLGTDNPDGRVSGGTVTCRGDGYYGYRLTRRGDDESAIYETEGTTSGIPPLNEQPDVYLNASVSVLNLLNFNAGVDASIDRVKLGIYNVTAKVELEARLGNILRMVDNVLESIDLNPIIATLGEGVSDIVDGIENNILYSVHNFEGSAHRNRVLAQDGKLLDIFLNNQGTERRRKEVGFYNRDMTFTGHNKTIPLEDGGVEYELQYVYQPYRGLSAYCNVYTNPNGDVLRTKIVAEAEGGGTATIAEMTRFEGYWRDLLLGTGK